MFEAPRSDFWQVGIVPARIETLDAARLAALADCIVWLQDADRWRYLADPFGLVRGERLHVFVEAYDYRIKRAWIERHDFDLASLQPLGHRAVLAGARHLSYPYVFEHEGEVWMVPECHQAGEIALYRATDARLDHWERDCALLPGVAGADASLIEWQGRWWMFYTVVGPRRQDQRELHIAHAPRLTGPWTLHPRNPVRDDLAGARPAGRPFVGLDGGLVLPVQDSSGGYGSATRLLHINSLSPDHFEAGLSTERLTGDLASASHGAGLHTLSACGELTLIDVKRIDRSRGRQWLDLKRRVRRLLHR
jgi:hypothetical protein